MDTLFWLFVVCIANLFYISSISSELSRVEWKLDSLMRKIEDLYPTRPYEGEYDYLDGLFDK